jgi:hypothetical protein
MMSASIPLPRSGVRRFLRLTALGVGLGAMAGCASHVVHAPSASVTAADGRWDGYVAEASRRFDIPESWIRAVMKVESGGKTAIGGRPTTSRTGAMGLMQVMPATYEALRIKHGLGSDPYDPHDNIIAGTAYLREMYDLYGAPGFLGAYNCGPGCYGDYLAGARRLPAETRNYIAMISPAIMAAPGPRRDPDGVEVAVAVVPAPGPRVPAPPVTLPVLPGPVLAAAAELPPELPAVIRESATPRAVAVAVAETMPVGGWAIQVGAFSTVETGQHALERVAVSLAGTAGRARPQVVPVYSAWGRLYRARLVGLSEDGAARACDQLAGRGMPCVTISPDRVY